MSEDVDPGDKVRRVEADLANPERILKQIGILMVAESQQAFAQQQFGGRQWQPRSVPNVFALIADFAAGKNPPARRFEARPALRDTGRLAASIAFRVLGNATEVGTNLPYAAVLNDGGEQKSEKITEAVQERLWKWLKGPGSQWKKRLGWLLNKKFRDQQLTHRIGARKFVGLSQQTMEDINEVIGSEIAQSLRPGG